MYEDRFSVWQRWQGRDGLENLKYQGVDAIAHSADPIAGTPSSWRSEIIYIGMTNAASGQRGRLTQFDNTIVGKTWQLAIEA